MNLYSYLQHLEKKYLHDTEINSPFLFSRLSQTELKEIMALPDLQNCSRTQIVLSPSFIIKEDFGVLENHSSNKEISVTCVTVKVGKNTDISKVFTNPYLYLYSFTKIKDSLSDEENYYIRYANIDNDFIQLRTFLKNTETNMPKEQTHSEVKSNFERFLDILTPQQRTEMIQRGLNPFNEDHVSKYLETYEKEIKFNFWQRLKFAWNYVISGIIPEQIKIAIIRELTCDLDKLSSLPIDSNSYEGEYNEYVTPFVEKILKKEPSSSRFLDPNYKDELKKNIQSKLNDIQGEQKKEEEVKNNKVTKTDLELKERKSNSSRRKRTTKTTNPSPKPRQTTRKNNKK